MALEIIETNLFICHQSASPSAKHGHYHYQLLQHTVNKPASTGQQSALEADLHKLTSLYRGEISLS